MKRIRGLVVTAGLGATLLAGCSSSGPSSPPPATSTAPAAATTQAPPLSSVPPATPAAAASTGTTVAGTALDSGGDQVRITVSLSPAVTASTITAPVMQQCGAVIAQTGSSLDRSVAIPFTITVDTETRLAVRVDVNISVLYDAAGSGQIQQSLVTPVWAMDYSDQPVCTTAAETINPGTIEYANAEPSTPQTGRGWIVLPGTITPTQPTGDIPAVNDLVLPLPLVTLGGAQAQFAYTPSAGFVQCDQSDPAAGQAVYIAYNVRAARAEGCTA